MAFKHWHRRTIPVVLCKNAGQYYPRNHVRCGAISVRKRGLWFGAILLAFQGLAGIASAQDYSQVHVLASEFPPYSFMENDQASGVAVEKAKQLFQQLDWQPEIRIVPWARAYETALQKENTLIFSMARTPERENQFQWIGELVDFDVNVYVSTKNKVFKPTRVEDLTAGVSAGIGKDVKSNFLESVGVRVIEVSNETQSISMLDRGRIDFVISDRASFDYRVKSLNLDPQSFVSPFKVEALSRPLYLAANLNTLPEVVDALRRALASSQ